MTLQKVCRGGFCFEFNILRNVSKETFLFFIFRDRDAGSWKLTKPDLQKVCRGVFFKFLLRNITNVSFFIFRDRDAGSWKLTKSDLQKVCRGFFFLNSF